MNPLRVLVALPPPEASAVSGVLGARGADGEPACEVALLDPEAQALLAAAGEGWTAVVLDAALAGPALLRALAAAEPAPALVLVADFGSVSDAVEAIRRGAFDYLSRPISAEQVAVAVRRAARQRALAEENEALRERLSSRRAFESLVTRDAAFARVLEVAASIADTRANVLITGESGTGKTLLARALHAASSRRRAPFVEMNCGALPAGLLESELFGHAKGAFTGAVRDKFGKFEAADGGTLFLDEIGTAPPEVQVKLLRVLHDRSFERLGETHTRQVDVRIVCATNEDLAAAVAAGRFREDLYYRVHVVRLEIPPLRERPLDVSLLARAFFERFQREHDRPLRGLTPEALASLAAHAWPGNVRQLENAIERAVLLARGPDLTPADFEVELGPRKGPARAAAPGPAALDFPVQSLKKALEVPEKAIIERALAFTGGNRQQTARLLGVNRTTLFNKMRKYGLLCSEPLDRSA